MLRVFTRPKCCKNVNAPTTVNFAYATHYCIFGLVIKRLGAIRLIHKQKTLGGVIQKQIHSNYWGEN